MIQKNVLLYFNVTLICLAAVYRDNDLLLQLNLILMCSLIVYNFSMCLFQCSGVQISYTQPLLLLCIYKKTLLLVFTYFLWLIC